MVGNNRARHDSLGAYTPLATFPPDPALTGVNPHQLWEVFPGQNVFFLKGHLMTAPDVPYLFITLGLIYIPMVLFFVFDASYLWHRLSPSVPLIAAILLAQATAHLLICGCMDPGVLPRNDFSNPQTEAELAEERNGFPPRTVIVNGEPVLVNYCETCRIYRPPRTHHCRKCDNCVERFDHHCPWVSNCIGKRNYRHFYGFLLVTTILSVYVMVFAVVHIVLLSKDYAREVGETGVPFVRALNHIPSTAILFFYCVCLGLSLSGLTSYHTYLLMRNMTTSEDLRIGARTHRDGRHPFGRRNNCRLLNVCDVMCGPRYPSVIQRFKTVYVNDFESDEEDNDADESEHTDDGLHSNETIGETRLGGVLEAMEEGESHRSLGGFSREGGSPWWSGGNSSDNRSHSRQSSQSRSQGAERESVHQMS